MASNNQRFTIGDALSTSENLAAYGQMLEGIDATLGVALRQHLASLASGQSVSTSALWDSLHSALATSDTQGGARDGSP
jgi:hypothetical protein